MIPSGKTSTDCPLKESPFSDSSVKEVFFLKSTQVAKNHFAFATALLWH
jgi:hypothetical protein